VRPEAGPELAPGPGRPAGTPAVREDLALSPGYHSPQVEVGVRLNTNESPVPPPEEWRRALAAELDGVAFHRYPDRQATALREAIAAHHRLSHDQVFPANGSNEVLQALLLAFGGPGREAVVFEPTYALHGHIARLTNTSLVRLGRRPDFGLDPAQVDQATRRSAAVVFLCSPNNPTGRADRPEEIEAVAASAGGLVVVDEAYGHFCQVSAVGLLERFERLVVVRTLSKAWSLAGLRLGYALAHPSVVDALFRVALPYHLDAVKQAGGRLALGYEAQMRQRVAALVAERERLGSGLAALGVQVWPSDANFLLFRPPGHRGRRVWEALLERSVLVRDLSSWTGLEGCLRVTVGSPEENDAFLAALAEVLG